MSGNQFNSSVPPSCECGCGRPTTIYLGSPRRFISGHNQAGRPQIYGDGPNPSGLCKCGCGGHAPLAKCGDSKNGRIKGKPLNYIPGHQTRNRATRKQPYYQIEDLGFDTPCWVWRSTRNSQGYGVVRRGGKNHLAHRFVYQRSKGRIEANVALHHLCENPSCVNPAHLTPISQADHMQAHDIAGARNPNAKFSAAQVRMIREMYARGEGSYPTLARHFAVSVRTIGQIVRGESYQTP